MPNAPAPPCRHLRLQMVRPTAECIGLQYIVRQVAQCNACGALLVRFTQPQLLCEWVPLSQSPRRAG